jgi:holo-ACP synthase
MWSKMSKEVLQGEKIDLPMMLDAREKRVSIQQELLMKHPHGALLSATMNIPGPIKTNEQIKTAFLTVIEAIEQLIPPEKRMAREYRDVVTGPEYYFVIKELPSELKEQMIQLEETHYCGRLFDLDVLYQKEQELISISRTELGYPARRCFICENEAKACGRNRQHSIEEMQQTISQLIEKGKMK